MVAGGTAPLLFVWDLTAGQLLYALHLPIPDTVYGTAQLHFLPDSQTVAGAMLTLRLHTILKTASTLECLSPQIMQLIC